MAFNTAYMVLKGISKLKMTLRNKGIIWELYTKGPLKLRKSIFNLQINFNLKMLL